MSSIQYVPLGDEGFRCTIVTKENEATSHVEAGHIELTIKDVASDAEPLLDGDERFRSNSSLVANLLNYGVNEYAKRRVDLEEKRKEFRKAAETHSRAALQLAIYASMDSYQTRRGWCSCCFEQTEHRVVDGKFLPQVCLCSSCGEATTPCVAPGCRHMARRPYGSVQLSPYCAEHRHEIQSFARATARYADLASIDDLRTFDKSNLAGITRTVLIAGVGAAVIAPMVFFAAPAIGGALATSGLIGPALSGAAATSHGLAFLGGGTLAAGGLGMAGGVTVVTATGAALGGTLGAVTATAYLQDDKSFRIEKLKDGTGTPVLVASGFLTQGITSWGAWEQIITTRYPDNPVYRVHWGAKELEALGAVVGGAGGAAIAGGFIKVAAAQANKAAAKLVPFLGGAVVAADLIANPWHVAKSRAEQTATVLANLLARVETPSFILVGHSLGARVMLCTAELLATKSGGPRLESIHLLGAAVGTGGGWKNLNESVREGVWNYRSTNDDVLKLVYPAAQGGRKAVGCVGFRTQFSNITDVDVSDVVHNHSAYYGNVTLRGGRPEE